MKPSMAWSAISTSAGSTRSAGLWLMPFSQRMNNIAVGTERGHHHRIVAGARGEAEIGLADRGDGLGEEGHKFRIAGGAGKVVDLLDREGRGAAFGDLPAFGEDRPGGRVASPRVERAHVEGEIDAAGDDVGRAGGDGQAADCCDDVGGGVARDTLGGEDHLGGGGERVGAERHRRRAGVAGHTGDGELVAELGGDAGDDADGEVLGFEDGALFDMGFEIGEGGFMARVEIGRQPILLIRHSRKSGNPWSRNVPFPWIPAFRRMTGELGESV